MELKDEIKMTKKNLKDHLSFLAIREMQTSEAIMLLKSVWRIV